MTTGTDNKLIIIRGKLNGDKATFDKDDSDSVIQVTFNPTEYSIDDGSSFAEAAIPGLDAPILQYSKGNARILSLELLLDTYAYAGGEDIRKKYIRKFEKLIKVDGEIHAPPICQVLWGSLSFVGVLESLKKKHTLFLDDGTPVRSRVTLSFKEYLPIEFQIKETSASSPDRLKSYTTKDGDSLWLIAFRAYGNPGYWREIANASNIDNPMELQLGQELTIPALRHFPEVGRGRI